MVRIVGVQPDPAVAAREEARQLGKPIRRDPGDAQVPQGVERGRDRGGGDGEPGSTGRIAMQRGRHRLQGPQRQSLDIERTGPPASRPMLRGH